MNYAGQNYILKAVLPGSAEGCSGGGGSLLGQICTGSGVTRAILTTKCWCVWLGMFGRCLYDRFSHFSRFCWLMFASLQHHAFYLLQHQWSVLLCQPKRQVLLALHHCSHPHDARGQHPDRAVHQPLLCVWSTFPGCGCAQPGHHHPPVSPGLAQPVDRILLPYGNLWCTTAPAMAALNVLISPLWWAHWDCVLWVTCRSLEHSLLASVHFFISWVAVAPSLLCLAPALISFGGNTAA